MSLDRLRVLIPVFHRPHRVHRLHENLDGIKHTFIIDDDDKVTLAAARGVKAEYLLMNEPTTTYARKINTGLSLSDEPVLFFAADDVLFHPGWAEAGLAKVDEGYRMVGSRDGLNLLVERGLHATHFFAEREYAENGGFNFDGKPGLCEAYRHNYVDNEAIAVAAYWQAFAPCPEARVEHLHHLNGASAYDDTYRLGDESKTDDMLLFTARLYDWLGGLSL